MNKERANVNNLLLQTLVLVSLLLSVTPLLGQQVERNVYQPGIDILHYDFTLDIPDSGNSIEGVAQIRVRRYRPVEVLRLDLLALRVDSVWINGRPQAFVRDSEKVTVELPKSRRSRPDTLMVSVRYGGTVQDGLVMQKNAQGRWSAFGDNWPNRGRQWLPSVDHPSDKATVTWNVRAPADRIVVANGELIERRSLPTDGRSKAVPRMLTRWRTTRPIPVYMMVVAVAPLKSYNLGLTASGLSEFPPGVWQTVYAAPELQGYLPGPFRRAGEIVEFFARTVGPFPYEKLDHVQSTSQYGGMENASAIFYGRDVFAQRNVTTSLIAHETAHQWFGDAVTPRDWPHLWLSEGFATYYEKLWLEKTEGKSEFRNEMKRMREEVLDAREVHERPVIDSLQTNLMALLNTNSYQKGGWVLHMLRSLVGDSLFQLGVRAYYERFRHATATTDDFCDQVEQVSGRRLRWFFDQWLRRPGYAIVSVNWKYDKSTRLVELEILQGKRFPPYRFPLTVELSFEDGTSQRATIQVEAQHQSKLRLPVSTSSAPAGLYLDPDVQLLGSFKTQRVD